MEAKHTATPWKLAKHGAIVGGTIREYTNGTWQDQIAMACVVQDDNGDQLANAEFIVRACNAHDDLVKALQDLEPILNSAESNASGTAQWEYVRDAVAAARAAIKKATEEA